MSESGIIKNERNRLKTGCITDDKHSPENLTSFRKRRQASRTHRIGLIKKPVTESNQESLRVNNSNDIAENLENVRLEVTEETEIIERTKRTIDQAEASTKILPVLKKQTCENESSNLSYDFDPKNSATRDKISLKVINDETFYEIQIYFSDFMGIRNRFPKLQDVLPAIDGDVKEINCSSDAVKYIFRYVAS